MNSLVKQYILITPKRKFQVNQLSLYNYIILLLYSQYSKTGMSGIFFHKTLLCRLYNNTLQICFLLSTKISCNKVLRFCNIKVQCTFYDIKTLNSNIFISRSNTMRSSYFILFISLFSLSLFLF